MKKTVAKPSFFIALNLIFFYYTSKRKSLMKSILIFLSIFAYFLQPINANAEDCSTYTDTNCTTYNETQCESACLYGKCKWENGTCTERCPTNNDGTCINYNGCYNSQQSDGWGNSITCAPCDQGYYNDGNFQTCQSCSSFSYSTGQIFDTAYANTYGLSTCPWMCNNGYYRGGANDDTCIQCTGNLNCSGTGLEYSNPVSNGIYCTGNTQIVYNDTTHTYSCESCSDSNASLDGTVCKCKEGYYGTLNGLNTTCTACPAGTTTGAAGATAKSACHMTQNTKFCDANGENCMKLLSGQNQNSINQ